MIDEQIIGSCGNDDRVRVHPNSVTRLGDDLADHRAAAREIDRA